MPQAARKSAEAKAALAREIHPLATPLPAPDLRGSFEGFVKAAGGDGQLAVRKKKPESEKTVYARMFAKVRRPALG